MDLQAIKTEAEYEKALSRTEKLMGAKKGTTKGKLLEVLSILLEAYEEQTFPIEIPDPVSAISFRMEQWGYAQKDLAKLLKSRSRASEILKRRRPLSMSTARLLNQKWRIPAEALLREPKIRKNLKAAG